MTSSVHHRHPFSHDEKVIEHSKQKQIDNKMDDNNNNNKHTVRSPTNNKINNGLLTDLCTKSTIYRRHEARLAKSYELKEDTRPAILRVMSLLPGFSMIVPPYDQLQQKTQSSTTKTTDINININTNPSNKIGIYSESTLFTTKDGDTTTSSPTSDFSLLQQKQQQQQQQPVVQAMFATAITSAIAEYIFGQGTANNKKSPFSGGGVGASTTTKYSSPFTAILHHGQDGDIQLQKQKQIPKQRQPTAVVAATAVSGRQIAIAASSTSLLFGTKVFMEEHVLINDNSSLSSPSINNTAVSAATAGAVVGMFKHRLAALPTTTAANTANTTKQQQQQLSMVRSNRMMMMIPRHMVTATLYFTAYEQLLNRLMTTTAASTNNDATTNNKKTNLNIMTAGATAGCVATIANHILLLQGQATSYIAMMNPSMMMVTTTKIIRAAPIHALIFLGYETFKEQARA